VRRQQRARCFRSPPACRSKLLRHIFADLEDLRSVGKQQMGAVRGVEEIEVRVGDRQGLRPGRGLTARVRAHRLGQRSKNGIRTFALERSSPIWSKSLIAVRAPTICSLLFPISLPAAAVYASSRALIILSR
jgi:hypothetical protein